MALPVYNYIPVATLASAVGLTETADILVRTPLLQRAIQGASARVNAYTHRVFTPTTLTRTFDAPGPGGLVGVGAQLLPSIGPNYNPFLPSPPLAGTVSAPLLVTDLQSVTSVVAFGQTLQPSDYQILHYQTDDGRPAGTEMIRLAGGVPVSWYYGATGAFQPWDAITVIGTFCYDPAAIPPVVQEITEELAVDRFLARTRMYGPVAIYPNGAPIRGESKRVSGLYADQEARLDVYVAGNATEFAL